MNAKEANKLIGKKVEWEYGHRGRLARSCLVAHGTIEEVKGRNIRISGNWLWLPDLINLKLEGGADAK
jgi:hypothetical protein